MGGLQYLLSHHLNRIVSQVSSLQLSSTPAKPFPSNLVYALLFLGLELCLLLDGASYFVLAAGNEAMHSHMQQASGAFGFIAGLMGYYACAHYMCEEALPFRIPMGQLKKRGKSRTA